MNRSFKLFSAYTFNDDVKISKLAEWKLDYKWYLYYIENKISDIVHCAWAVKSEYFGRIIMIYVWSLIYGGIDEKCFLNWLFRFQFKANPQAHMFVFISLNFTIGEMKPSGFTMEKIYLILNRT